MLDSIRRYVNARPAVGTFLMLGLVAGAIYLAVRASRPVNTAGCDYYDEATGETSKYSIKEVPPLPGKTGEPTLVRAYYHANDNGTRQLCYLEKYSAAAKEALERHFREKRSGPPDLPDPDHAHLVRWPAAGAKWAPIDSPEGRKIVSSQFTGAVP